MKRFILAAALTVAAMGPAIADEMPIKGSCVSVSGTDTVTFTGSRMPIVDSSTGELRPETPQALRYPTGFVNLSWHSY